MHLFRDELVRDLSRITAQKVLITLKAILKDARRRGTLASDPAEGVSIKADKRAAAKLQIGVDIPHGRKLPGSLPLRRDARDRSL